MTSCCKQITAVLEMAPPPDEHEDLFGTGGSKNRPCRTCTDFKSWSKVQKASLQNNKDNKKETPARTHLDTSNDTPRQCPVDKDELGRSTWTFLHTMAAYYPSKPTATESRDMQQFIGLFSKFYPCNVCAEDMREEIKVAPPNTSSQSTLCQWFCELHNKVNAKLGKPLFDCRRVNERWRDGPADGSCD